MPTENQNLNIEYKGFSPDAESEYKIKTTLTGLLESCPYDSIVKAKIADHDDHYLVEIFVHHQSGKFSAIGEETTLSEALSVAASELTARLQDWRLTRFNQASKETQEGLDVLIVDDDPLAIRLLETCLQENGCRTVAAENGERAMEKIERQKFDLVVMDWMMPRLNGGQTVSAIDRKIKKKNNSSTQKIPVLTYSICEKGKIQFPKTDVLFQIGHMSKIASYQILQKLTRELLRQVKETMSPQPQPATVNS